MLKVWDDTVHGAGHFWSGDRDHVMIPFEELRGRLLDQ